HQFLSSFASVGRHRLPSECKYACDTCDKEHEGHTPVGRKSHEQSQRMANLNVGHYPSGARVGIDRMLDKDREHCHDTQPVKFMLSYAAAARRICLTSQFRRTSVS